MGPANKNTITHTDSRYYRVVDGDEKVQNGVPGHPQAHPDSSGRAWGCHPSSIASTKKTYFLSTNQLFSLDYSGKMVYCAET